MMEKCHTVGNGNSAIKSTDDISCVVNAFQMSPLDERIKLSGSWQISDLGTVVDRKPNISVFSPHHLPVPVCDPQKMHFVDSDDEDKDKEESKEVEESKEGPKEEAVCQRSTAF